MELHNRAMPERAKIGKVILRRGLRLASKTGYEHGPSRAIRHPPSVIRHLDPTGVAAGRVWPRELGARRAGIVGRRGVFGVGKQGPRGRAGAWP